MKMKTYQHWYQQNNSNILGDKSIKIPFMTHILKCYWCVGGIGIVISPSYILTTGYCASGEDYRWSDRAFAVLTTGNLKRSSLVQRDIDRVIVHEGYTRNDPRAQDNIGLIRLKAPMKFGRYLWPIPLPSNNIIPREGKAFQTFGYDVIPRCYYYNNMRIPVETIEKKVVSEDITLDIASDPKDTKNISSYFCGIEKNYNYKRRQLPKLFPNEPGGPAVMRGKLAGLLAFKIPNYTNPRADLYVPVNRYFKWILQNTGSDAKFIKKLSRKRKYRLTVEAF